MHHLLHVSSTVYPILTCLSYLLFDLVTDSPQKDIYNRSMDIGSCTAEGIYTM